MPPRPLIAALLLAAMAAAPPANASFGGWMLYFESGSVELTEVADPLIRETFAPLTKIVVENGDILVIEAHTDRVGSREANQRLSCARARALKARFVEVGYLPERMHIYGYGEDRPLVATADEVAEMVNNYASIEFIPARTTAVAASGSAPQAARGPAEPSVAAWVDPDAC